MQDFALQIERKAEDRTREMCKPQKPDGARSASDWSAEEHPVLGWTSPTEADTEKGSRTLAYSGHRYFPSWKYCRFSIHFRHSSFCSNLLFLLKLHLKKTCLDITGLKEVKAQEAAEKEEDESEDNVRARRDDSGDALVPLDDDTSAQTEELKVLKESAEITVPQNIGEVVIEGEDVEDGIDENTEEEIEETIDENTVSVSPEIAIDVIAIVKL